MSDKGLFFVSVGSNIDPGNNMERGLRALLETAPTLHMSRVVETEAVEVSGSASFLNLAVAFYSRLDETALKRRLNAIELAVGRDRDDPARSIKPRVLDLDILLRLEGERRLPAERVPHAPYIRPVALELADYLAVSCDVTRPPLAPGVSIRVGRHQVGEAPCTLVLDRGSREVELFDSPREASA